MIDQHELVAAARYAREFNLLAAKGLLIPEAGAARFPKPDHPDVKAFRALPVPESDMIARGRLFHEAGMMVAEARQTNRSPEIIAKATAFAVSVAEMPMDEVQKWLKHFLAEKGTGATA